MSPSPGLPYHVGGVIPDRDSLLLQTPESLAEALALDVRTGQDMIRIDRGAREVAAGMDYRKVYTHQNGHAAYYPGTAPLFLKVLFDPAGGRLLGAQVLGWDGVDKRIDVLAVALRAGMTEFDLEHLELAYAPPTGRRMTRSPWPVSWARTCRAATSTCGTPRTTRTAPGT